MSTKNSNFFSRDCMVQALIQLLKTKSLSNITITELTERAGVSRMTYYRNYHSPSGCCDMAGQGQLQ